MIIFQLIIVVDDEIMGPGDCTDTCSSYSIFCIDSLLHGKRQPFFCLNMGGKGHKLGNYDSFSRLYFILSDKGCVCRDGGCVPSIDE